MPGVSSNCGMYSVGHVQSHHQSEAVRITLQHAVSLSHTKLALSHIYPTHTQEMIDEADKDGDGEVSEAEFLRIMKKTNMYQCKSCDTVF